MSDFMVPEDTTWLWNHNTTEIWFHTVVQYLQNIILLVIHWLRVWIKSWILLLLLIKFGHVVQLRPIVLHSMIPYHVPYSKEFVWITHPNHEASTVNLQPIKSLVANWWIIDVFFASTVWMTRYHTHTGWYLVTRPTRICHNINSVPLIDILYGTSYQSIRIGLYIQLISIQNIGKYWPSS